MQKTYNVVVDEAGKISQEIPQGLPGISEIIVYFKLSDENTTSINVSDVIINTCNEPGK